MNELTIQKNVPIQLNKEVGRVKKYPFNSMEIGDSFFVKGDKKVGQLLYSAAHTNGKMHGKKFITRKQSGDVYRCWRIK